MRQGEEQLSPGLQEREVRRQPGEERDKRLESVTRRGKIFLSVPRHMLVNTKYGPLIFYT